MLELELYRWVRGKYWSKKEKEMEKKGIRRGENDILMLFAGITASHKGEVGSGPSPGSRRPGTSGEIEVWAEVLLLDVEVGIGGGHSGV